MNLQYSPHFVSSYKKLVKMNKYLEVLIEERIKLFIVNKNHPSLRLHKLEGNLRTNWSISIEQNLRIVFIYLDEDVAFIDIGSHDEVYK